MHSTSLFDFWTTMIPLKLFLFLNQISRVVLPFPTKLIGKWCLSMLPLHNQRLKIFALSLDLFEMLLGFESKLPFFDANFIDLLLVHLFFLVSLDSMLLNFLSILIVFFLVSFHLLIMAFFLVLNLLIVLGSELCLLFKLNFFKTRHCWHMDPGKCTNKSVILIELLVKLDIVVKGFFFTFFFQLFYRLMLLD